jgi:hypothetical protein
MPSTASVSDLRRDVVLAVRRLKGAPASTAFSVITLAVGIGMTTAAYAVIQGTLLRPPKIRDIDQVVNVDTRIHSVCHQGRERSGSEPRPA